MPWQPTRLRNTGRLDHALCLVALMTVCSAGCGDRGNDHPHSRMQGTTPVEFVAASGPANSSEAPRDFSDSLPRIEPVEDSRLESSSQQQPFEEAYWVGDGWTFDGTSMSSTAITPAAATFRRPYSKLMLQTELAAINDGGEFVLRLHAHETDCGLSIVLREAELEVAVDRAGSEPAILQTRELSPPLQPGESQSLRLTATGNRLQIIWNNSRLLLCNQPSEQSGHALFITIRSRNGGFRIDQLRLEGE